MRKLRLIFSILTVVFASLGLAKILSYDISLPLMFVSMILTFLVWSKECYDKGSKRDSYIFLGVAIFIAAITAFNIISTLSSKDKSTEIPKGNPQFMATVLGFEDNYILVDPYKGDEAINSMDMAFVSKDVISKIDVPDVKEGDKVSEDHQEFTARYNADEVIVLLSTFDVDESGGDGSLNPNSTYTDWNWILVRKNGGKWKHVDHGY